MGRHATDRGQGCRPPEGPTRRRMRRRRAGAPVPLRGAPRPARGASAPHSQRCAGLLRGRASGAAASRPPPLFAHSASALAPGPPAPARVRSGAARPAPASRPRSGARRPSSASLRPPGPGPGGGPPALPLGRLCAASRLRGRSLAPLRLGSASAVLRASSAALRSPLLRSASPLRFAWPRRVPPPPVRFAASGPVASAPGACAALRAACCASGPLRFAGRWPAARARLRALRCRRPGCCACLRAARVRGCAALPGALLLRWPGASPCLPPAPAAPPGLAGCVRLRLGAAAPPSGLPFWSVLLDPVRYFGLGP